MNTIDYDHSNNVHTVQGAAAALSAILQLYPAKSLLDVGCGIGTWLTAAKAMGIKDFLGIDGVDVDDNAFMAAKAHFSRRDFTMPWDLERRFDIALCLEVAEHIDRQHSNLLIQSLTKHTDTVIFSAACPGQLGQHHVNCQWPSWWQDLFNEQGYTCNDRIRWAIWNKNQIEPWYQQNMFVATNDPENAGLEPRLISVIHPRMIDFIQTNRQAEERLNAINRGEMSMIWYLTSPTRWIRHRIRGGGFPFCRSHNASVSDA